MRLLGEIERTHTARKEHRCDLGTDCTIHPGDTYFVGVTMPGENRYPIAPDDWETVDYPFTTMKACVKHYNEEMEGAL